MIFALPQILHEEKYKDTWEWDDWKPKAKPDAPQEVKKAIASWVKEIEKANEELDSFLM